MTKKNDQSVLGNLPSTRPARIGRRREGASARAEAPAAKPAAATKAKSAPAKRKPAAATAAKPKAAKPRATAPKPPAAAPKKPAGPRAVRSGAPALDREPRPSVSVPPPPPSPPEKGTGVVTTAVQAAGELAQIGITLGGQVAKRALKRIPKP